MARRSAPTRRVAFAVAATALCAWLVASAGASAGVTHPFATLARVGPAVARPSGATMTRPVALAAPLRVTVTLRPRDPAALAAYARAVSTPDSPNYRRFLSPSSFGRRFGATDAQIALVREALQARGLRPGPASPGHLSISLRATAGQLERAFAVSLQTLSLPRRKLAIAASARPAVPAAVAGIVQSVLGLNSEATMRPLLERHTRARSSQKTPASTIGARAPHSTAHATVAPEACAEAQTAAAQQRAYTDDQIAATYGFGPVYASGDGGAGVTVAVYELEPVDPADISHFQTCFGTHAQISYVPVDGGAGPPGPGTGEAALDIENLIGFAPDANVIVYQGPNSSSNAPGYGPYDTFKAIIDQDVAKVVSVSWGQCEALVTQADASAENTLFEQATVQGQSIVAADGDNGAEDCYGASTGNPLGAAVDDPSSQPYVTGVGGTTLSALGSRPTESVWNSGGTPIGSGEQAGASGGGVSSFWPMAPAQLDAAASLHVRSSATGGPCGSSTIPCRAVPDVAADADPATGYLIYFNGSGTAGYPTGWQTIGGTSAAAPLWAAVIALADASRGCATSSVGFANPALYRAASTAYPTDFNDVTTGNNDFTGTNGGRYGAATGYDLATGLGTPNAAALIASLCADTLQMTTPAAQRSTAGAVISLRLHAQDTAGTGVTFAGAMGNGTTGLPPGLKLSTAGVISGRPTRPGHYVVHLRAQDSQLSGAAVVFPWIVGGRPQISRLSLRSRPHGRGTLAFTVTAGRNAPPLQSVSITLPAALRLTGAGRGVVARSAGRPSRPVAARSRAVGPRTLQITLRRSAGAIQISLAPTILRLVGRIPNMARRGRRSPMLTVNVIDARAGRLQLSSRLRESR